jgi:RNA polymerase sigma-70 factor, ECF subfamily
MNAVLKTAERLPEYRGLIATHARQFFDSREDIEDVIGDVYLKLLKSEANEYNGTRGAISFIATVTRNRCIEILRRRKLKTAPECFGEKIPARSAPEIGAQMLLEMVAERNRELVRLHFIEGYSFEELSAITGLPKGSVASRIGRAIRAARRAHGGEE